MVKGGKGSLVFSTLVFIFKKRKGMKKMCVYVCVSVSVHTHKYTKMCIKHICVHMPRLSLGE